MSGRVQLDLRYDGALSGSAVGEGAMAITLISRFLSASQSARRSE
jgi:hypothetical protein